jgi:hypothetical protein
MLLFAWFISLLCSIPQVRKSVDPWSKIRNDKNTYYDIPLFNCNVETWILFTPTLFVSRF